MKFHDTIVFFSRMRADKIILHDTLSAVILCGWIDDKIRLLT